MIKEIFGFLKARRVLILKILTWVILLTTTYNYIRTIGKFSINFPLGDDYDAILNFLNHWDESDSKFSLLFSQHNEHRLVFLRIVALAYFKIFHSVNFAHLIWIGNLFLFFTIGVLYVSTKDKRKFFFFAPIFLWILTYSNWESETWAMASLSNFPVLFFAFLSFFFLSKRTLTSFVFSIFFAFLSVFSQGNGLVVFAVGIVFLLKDKIRLAIWIVCGLLAIYIYFILFSYLKPAHSKFEFFAFERMFFLTRLFYGMTLLSSVFQSKFSLVLGAVPLVFIFYLYKNYKRISTLLLAMLSFLLISYTSVVFTRGGFGFEQAFVSRYQVYTISIYALIFLSLLPKIRIRKHLFLILLFSGLFYYNSNLLNVHSLQVRKDSILTDQKCGEECSTYLTYPEPERAKNILTQSKTKGVFHNEK